MNEFECADESKKKITKNTAKWLMLKIMIRAIGSDMQFTIANGNDGPSKLVTQFF